MSLQLEYLDDDFEKFLEQKIDRSQDMEERAALSSLLQTIAVVKEKVQAAQDEG
jgi:hypothetical protein